MSAPRSNVRVRRLLLLLVALVTVGVAAPSAHAATAGHDSRQGHRTGASSTQAAVGGAGTHAALHRHTAPADQQALRAGHPTHPTPPAPPTADGTSGGLSAPELLAQLPRPPGDSLSSTSPAAPTGRSPPFSAGT